METSTRNISAPARTLPSSRIPTHYRCPLSIPQITLSEKQPPPSLSLPRPPCLPSPTHTYFFPHTMSNQLTHPLPPPLHSLPPRLPQRPCRLLPTLTPLLSSPHFPPKSLPLSHPLPPLSHHHIHLPHSHTLHCKAGALGSDIKIESS